MIESLTIERENLLYGMFPDAGSPILIGIVIFGISIVIASAFARRPQQPPKATKKKLVFEYDRLPDLQLSNSLNTSISSGGSVSSSSTSSLRRDDILCDCNGDIVHDLGHHGNRIFWKLIESNQEIFWKLSREKRVLVSQSIVTTMKASERLFLMENKHGEYEEMPQWKAIEKTFTSLRDGRRRSKRSTRLRSRKPERDLDAVLLDIPIY